MATSNPKLLIINPNSSDVITQALVSNLTPLCPPGIELEFKTGPPDAPPSINDPPTSILSAAATFKAMEPIDQQPYAGFLVCCFSDHPLVHYLRNAAPDKPCIGIFDASVVHALSSGSKFGILTTGAAMVPAIDVAVTAFLGGISGRYVGCIASGLGVVELQTSSDRGTIEGHIKGTAAKVSALGADVIILGCAGMSGMEDLVKAGVAEAGGRPVAVIDGAKAGVQVLAGLVRSL
ncbi:hypothetical protein BDN71DRAFT_1468196 [Pleurotus eryngii]|uniref:Asp/Glu/hydantoin racemase n=1 Tax=Pleurotus eryngii TaxID=5323 RepID=A0A9P6DHU8_PLEER|nr:hypothetical protein BDN71DRAFT_1468196 [Pleurotus eryngii]